MNKEEEAELKRKVDIMWRGMYGDEDNDIPGLVDDRKYLEKIKKAVYVGSGAIIACQVLYWAAKELHVF